MAYSAWKGKVFMHKKPIGLFLNNERWRKLIMPMLLSFEAENAIFLGHSQRLYFNNNFVMHIIIAVSNWAPSVTISMHGDYDAMTSFLSTIVFFVENNN